MFKVNNKDTRTTQLAFRIFDKKGTTPFPVHSKICVSGDVVDKKVTESKIGSKGFNLTKKWFHSTEISKESSMFIFFLHIRFSCSDSITARNSKTKPYKVLPLSRCVLALV